jgi:hypothetical protein
MMNAEDGMMNPFASRTIVLVVVLVLVLEPVATGRASQAFAQDSILVTTFLNPEPAPIDNFGNAVAAVGTDKVLIGAYFSNVGATNAGAAFLFDTPGHLLTSYTNPTPAFGEQFGRSVAAVGGDKVVIGAVLDDAVSADSGAAYLYDLGGTLLTTFTNPSPAASGDQFGISVAAVGSNRVVIGASGKTVEGTKAGAAYLFAQGGALLTIFTNPAPSAGDEFGWAVAGVNSNRVLIGARLDDENATNAGAAFLFDTSGALMATFHNPTPAPNDQFGWSLAAVGTNKVLIGAWSDDTGATNAGAAYLFSTDGNLLMTFTNPTPENFESFGDSVAAVGTGRVVIGATDAYIGTTNTGEAYLFDLNGTLLETLANPDPDSNDFFGDAVAAVGSEQILVTASQDGTVAPSAGTAYLFAPAATNPPLLTIGRAADPFVTVAWPWPSAGWVLQEDVSVIATNWTEPPEPVDGNGTVKFIQVTPERGQGFYRLLRR